MKILLLVVLSLILSSTFSLKVAYIGDAADKMYDKFLIPYGEKNDGINISFVENKNSIGYDTELKAAVEKNAEIVLMTCDDNMYKSNSSVLIDNKVLVICTNTYTSGRCSKNIISGVSTIPLIENSI